MKILHSSIIFPKTLQKKVEEVFRNLRIRNTTDVGPFELLQGEISQEDFEEFAQENRTLLQGDVFFILEDGVILEYDFLEYDFYGNGGAIERREIRETIL